MLSKISKLFEIIKLNGGIFGSIRKIWLMDELKDGRLVGQDQFGNKYFENNRFFMCRNRWVEYNRNYYFDYDGSQITPEWHGWMHYSTDMLPCEDSRKQFYCWMLNHTENMTGTKFAYYPYNTTRPKIVAWDPNKDKCK